MPFKCRFLARDKASAKLLVARYEEDLLATAAAMMTAFIDALDDEAVLAEGVLRVIEVFAEGNTEYDDAKTMKVSVCYRLVL